MPTDGCKFTSARTNYLEFHHFKSSTRIANEAERERERIKPAKQKILFSFQLCLLKSWREAVFSIFHTERPSFQLDLTEDSVKSWRERGLIAIYEKLVVEWGCSKSNYRNERILKPGKKKFKSKYKLAQNRQWVRQNIMHTTIY